MKNLLTLAFALYTIVPAIAQKSFNGTITYGMEYKELPAQLQGMESMLPSEMTVKVKGDQTKVEQSLGMGMRQATIINTKKETAVVLMDMMGKKMKMEMDLKEMEAKEKKKKNSDIDIKYTDEEKTIAGFKCKKAVITSEGDKGSVHVYYTEDLPSSASREFDGLKGFPLEFERNEQGMSVRIFAKDVEKGNVDDSTFEVPDGYEEMNPAMIEKMMGG